MFTTRVHDMTRPLLLNTKAMAKALGIGRTTLTHYKRLGLRFDYGRLATVEHVLAWLKEHSDMVANHAAYQPLSERPEWMANISKVRSSAAAGRRGARSLKSGSRASSRSTPGRQPVPNAK